MLAIYGKQLRYIWYMVEDLKRKNIILTTLLKQDNKINYKFYNKRFWLNAKISEQFTHALNW